MAGRSLTKTYPVLPGTHAVGGPGAGDHSLGGFGPAPGPDDLAAIHRLTLAPLPAEALYVRRMAVANTRVDRSFERFPVAYLERFAGTIVGKSLLISHQKSALAMGVIYQAQVVPAPDGEHELLARFYLPITPGNEEVRGLIDAGVVRYVSIGATYDQRLCSVCDRDYWDCPHMPGETIRPSDGHPGGRLVTYTFGGDLSRVEAREVSLVYLGAQLGAEIRKSEGSEMRGEGSGAGEGVASPPGTHAAGEDRSEGTPPLAPHPWPLAPGGGTTTMESEKALARIRELEGQIKGLEERLVAHEREKAQWASGAGPDEATKALIDDGKAYREHLRGEAKRLAGIVRSEAEASLLLQALPHAPAAQLQSLVDGYQARVNELYPPRPDGELPGGGADPTPPPAGFRRPVRVG